MGKKNLYVELRELEEERWRHVLAMGYFVSSNGYDASKLWEIDSSKNIINEILMERSDFVLDQLSKKIQIIRDALVVKNQGLVYRIVKHRVKRSVGILDLEDFQIYGTLGLMVALDRFDVNRKLQFSTYASSWIVAYVLRALGKHGSAVRNPLRKGVLAKVISIEERVNDVQTIKDTLVLEEKEDTSHHSGISEDQVRKAMLKLPSRHKKILMERFYEDKTLKQVGEEMDLSRERIRQLQNDALNELRYDLGVN